MADISLPASAASLQTRLDDVLLAHSLMIELGAQTLWITDAAGAPISIGGASMSEEVRRRRRGRIHPADLAGCKRLWAEALATGNPFEAQLRIASVEGEYRWMRMRARALRDGEGTILRWYGVTIDIEDQVQAYRALRETEERYRLAARAAGDSIWDWDLTSNRVQWSEGVTELFGYSPAEMNSGIEWWLDRIHPEDRERVETSIHASIASRAQRWSDEYRFLRADGRYADVLDRGHLLCGVDGSPLRMVGAMHDLSERKRREAQVYWLAWHDTLTGLPNRRRFLEELEASLPTPDRPATMFAVLLVDLDEFKRINDTLGHPAGDALLQAVADRLREVVGPAGIVARLGGDEFAVILRGVGNSAEVTDRIEALLAALRVPF
jgi:PAS domain S-box-containing protein